MGGWGLPQTYDDLKEVVGLPGRPVFPGHHGGASGIATQGLKTMSLTRGRLARAFITFLKDQLLTLLIQLYVCFFKLISTNIISYLPVFS